MKKSIGFLFVLLVGAFFMSSCGGNAGAAQLPTGAATQSSITPEPLGTGAATANLPMFKPNSTTFKQATQTAVAAIGNATATMSAQIGLTVTSSFNAGMTAAAPTLTKTPINTPTPSNQMQIAAGITGTQAMLTATAAASITPTKTPTKTQTPSLTPFDPNGTIAAGIAQTFIAQTPTATATSTYTPVVVANIQGTAFAQGQTAAAPTVTPPLNETDVQATVVAAVNATDLAKNGASATPTITPTATAPQGFIYVGKLQIEPLKTTFRIYVPTGFTPANQTFQVWFDGAGLGSMLVSADRSCYGSIFIPGYGVIQLGKAGTDPKCTNPQEGFWKILNLYTDKGGSVYFTPA